jgi:hypothetical protein
MTNNDTYIPMNQLIMDKETSWTFTSLNIPYHEIAQKGIVLWCVDNLSGRWTMLGGNKFGFEDAQDALMFKIQFGIGSR